MSIARMRLLSPGRARAMQWLRAAAYVAALVLSAGPAAAQAPPQPPPPGEPAPGQPFPGQQPDQGAAAPQPHTTPWTASTSVSSLYDNNVLFVDGGPSDLATRVAGTLSRSWSLKRGTVSLGGDVSELFYQNTTSLNGLRYSIGAAVSHAVTSRLAVTFAGNVSSSLSQDSQVIRDSGALLPSVVTRTGSSALGVSYALSRKTQVSWSLAEQGVGFASGGLQGGSTAGSTLTLTRQVASAQTIGVTQSYSRTFGGGGGTGIQSYLADWSISFGRYWTAQANGGIRPYTIPGEAGYRISPAAEASLNRMLREGHTVGIYYNRTLEQAFGLNRTHLVQTAGGTYSGKLTQRISANVSGSYSLGTYPLLPDLRLIGVLFDSSVSCLVGHNLSIVAGASKYWKTITPDPTTISTRFNVSVSYGTSFR